MTLVEAAIRVSVKGSRLCGPDGRVVMEGCRDHPRTHWQM